MTPYIVVIAGPNGAGKTTISRAVIAGSMSLAEYVNADVIAQGLSGFAVTKSRKCSARERQLTLL